VAAQSGARPPPGPRSSRGAGRPGPGPRRHRRRPPAREPAAGPAAAGAARDRRCGRADGRCERQGQPVRHRPTTGRPAPPRPGAPRWRPGPVGPAEPRRWPESRRSGPATARAGARPGPTAAPGTGSADPGALAPGRDPAAAPGRPRSARQALVGDGDLDAGGRRRNVPGEQEDCTTEDKHERQEDQNAAQDSSPFLAARDRTALPSRQWPAAGWLPRQGVPVLYRRRRRLSTARG
jgi:hypothetical protein